MLKFTLATRDDSEQLSSMGYASYRHHFAHLWKNPQELATYLEQEYASPAIARSFTEDDTHWLIALTDVPVGFAKFTLHQPIEPEGRVGTLLHKIYLMPGETGKQYGEQILAEVMRHARAHGDACLWLEVLADNLRARQFYERQGMTFVKETIFTTASQTVTLNVMAKQL